MLLSYLLTRDDQLSELNPIAAFDRGDRVCCCVCPCGQHVWFKWNWPPKMWWPLWSGFCASEISFRLNYAQIWCNRSRNGWEKLAEERNEIKGESSQKC